jgi:hypothetical protein
MAATVAAAVLRFRQLAPPNLFGVLQYDDGVYFGSAVRLVHGVLPYRDFVMVQPPGITLLMAPVALLSKAVGTVWGMAAGRILTVLASTAAVIMVGLLVRHRGVLAVTVACGIMTVYPGNLVASRTVMVEPWLVLFTLTGAVLAFNGDRLTASWRRIAWSGAAIGFSGAIEVWAVFPFVVLLVLMLPASPPFPRFRRAAIFTAATAGGFCVSVLPFAALAPRGLYRSVVIAQLGRVVTRTPLLFRLQEMTGAGQIPGLTIAAVLAIALTVVALIAVPTVAAWLISRRPPPTLDQFAMTTAALVAAVFLWYPQFFRHFSAFLAPFLSMSLALPIARLLAVARIAPRARTAGTARGWRAAGWAFLVIGGVTAIQASQTVVPGPYVRPAAIEAAQRIIPLGSCVATDQVSFLLAANRFTSDVPGCSPMVDGLATDYALSHRDGFTGANRFPAVPATWRREFARADYAWLAFPFNHYRISWTPSLRAYFRTHFTPVLRDGNHHDVIYVRRP